jgi:hypothetical protein
MYHHIIVATLGRKEELDDPGHHAEHPTLRVKEILGITSCNNKSTDPIMSVTSITTKTRMLRWEPTTLPIGFAGLSYPEVKLPHDHQKYDGSQEPKYGYPTTCKPSSYSGDPRP